MTRKSLKITLIALISLANACCKESEIPKFLKQLYSANAKDRNDAALGLAQCGSPRADGAVPRLIQLIYDENVGVQSAAAYALRKIDTPEAKNALRKAEEKTKNRKSH